MQSSFFSQIKSKDEVKKLIDSFEAFAKLDTSEELKDYFNLLKKGALEGNNQLTEQTLIEGIRKFTKIANLSFEARKTFYGNEYLGLHYDNDLATLLNARDPARGISVTQVDRICPPSWRSEYSDPEDPYQFLIYTGKEPLSIGLNELIKGPTVLDCGMFCQLCIWMGMRYYLGDEIFNQLFDYTPFYLTQMLWVSIRDAKRPFRGNPLYSFFDTKDHTKVLESALFLLHIPNHAKYLIKHPGGNAGGQNTLVMNGLHTIFKPTLLKAENLTRKEVEKLLREAYNAPQDEFDRAKLGLYQKMGNRMRFDLGHSFNALIDLAQEYEDQEIDEATWANVQQEKEFSQLNFNFNRFQQWVEQTQKSRQLSDQIDYIPLTATTAATLSKDEIEEIPYEARACSFANFKKASELQRELYDIGLKFCDSVMKSQPSFVVLGGESGIGKTAVLSACYKELISQGKRVLWLSRLDNPELGDSIELAQLEKDLKDEHENFEEKIFKASALPQTYDKQSLLAHIENYRDGLSFYLNKNIDAIFLDDSLPNYRGTLLFKAVYYWYIRYNKGLFITANYNVLHESYGDSLLDDNFHYLPFIDYNSLAYQNMIFRYGLKGVSLRPAVGRNLLDCSEEEQMQYLLQHQLECSIAVIVSYNTYKTWENRLEDKEFIPSIDENILSFIRQSLRDNNTCDSTFSELSDFQKEWLEVFQAGGKQLVCTLNGKRCTKLIPFYKGIKVKKFEETVHKTIVVEIAHTMNSSYAKIISNDCVIQLHRALHYTYHKGGMRLVIVNRSDFTMKEVLEKFEYQLPAAEKAGTMSRLKSLLGLDPSLELEDDLRTSLSIL